MKVIVSATLLGFDGEVVKHGRMVNGETVEEPLTLAGACTFALMSQFPDEQTLTGDEKLNRHLLAARIHEAANGDGDGAVDLKAEDVALLKRLVAKAWSTRACGPALLLLDA